MELFRQTFGLECCGMLRTHPVDGARESVFVASADMGEPQQFAVGCVQALCMSRVLLMHSSEACAKPNLVWRCGGGVGGRKRLRKRVRGGAASAPAVHVVLCVVTRW